VNGRQLACGPVASAAGAATDDRTRRLETTTGVQGAFTRVGLPRRLLTGYAVEILPRRPRLGVCRRPAEGAWACRSRRKMRSFSRDRPPRP
jgi:hypothetical protein